MHVGVPAGQTQQETISNGTDAASRKQRRAWRDRLNGRASRKTLVGVLATLAGAGLWGFSGTSASMLFDVYHVDTLWLLSVRQIFAGLLFMVLIAFTARDRFVRLWTNPAHIRTQLLFTLFGLFANQLFYLIAIRLTNAGTATVLQCLELIIIMVITCVRQTRGPRKRELAGLILALLGTFLIATGACHLACRPYRRFADCGLCGGDGHDPREPVARIWLPGGYGFCHDALGYHHLRLHPAVEQRARA